VIAFDYSAAADVGRSSKMAKGSVPPYVGSHGMLHGEIFVCVDEAVAKPVVFAQVGNPSWCAMSSMACYIFAVLRTTAPQFAAK